MVGAKFLHIVDPAHALVAIAAAVLLLGAVFSAVYHAEVVALRVGEPFGSIVLAASVTVIEVALIISIMLSAPGGGEEIARDTVFAAVMIVLNGIVGICLLVGGLRYHEQNFHIGGASGALVVIGTLATLALILPNYTEAVPGPVYSHAQLIVVGGASLVLYALFLFVQTVRHREYFLDPDQPHGEHAVPSWNAFFVSAGLLLVSLVSVVLLAKTLSPAVEHGVSAAGLPEAFVGVIIAAVVLMPEGLSAFRAAKADKLQGSLNLALGSALASIGLTIPAVGLVSILLDIDLVLGLEGEHEVLLALTLFASIVTLGTGRTTVLQGGVHLTIFLAFLLIAAVP
ncbi:ionic transporter y4hA [Acuticoccus sp. M5D2P5]|uniref:calcium:proton antiporter n=1 Tax=Acuticoccus kalidii TaxID=2910977 RepID=UPI001F41CC70|nr:ionic transporter y4hA [Acuticoccus kalidii]MCF3933398.1 ionic transporter y4hA [Acuticoccus kalidii]